MLVFINEEGIFYLMLFKFYPIHEAKATMSQTCV